ncbi:MAG: polysaccharide deacetylase family protein [Clostridia bacterium]|nr:polysaccharide deacetylase family protein [Clostridia bacterium]
MKKVISIFLCFIIIFTGTAFAADDVNIIFEAYDTTGISSFIRGTVTDVAGVGGRPASDSSVYAQVTELESVSDTPSNGYFQYSVGSKTSDGTWSLAGGEGYLVIEGYILPENGIKFRFTTNGGNPVSGDLGITDGVWNKFSVVYDFSTGLIMNIVNGRGEDWKETVYGTVNSSGTLRNALRMQIIGEEGKTSAYFDDYRIYTTTRMPDYVTAVSLVSEYSGSDTLSKLSPLRAENSIEYGIGGKPAYDAVGRLDATEMTDDSRNFFTNTSVTVADKLTVSFMVYPNETVNGIWLATDGHARLSSSVYNINMLMGQWNRITYVYDSSSGISDLYVNDKHHSSTKASVKTKIRLVFDVASEDFSDGYVYYDDFFIYSSAVAPVISSEAYTIRGVRINGYADSSVSELAAGLNFAVSGYTARVYDNLGKLCGGDVAAKEGFLLEVLDGSCVVGRYIIGEPYYEIADNIMLSTDGYFPAVTKYGKGRLGLSCDGTVYRGTREIYAVIARYSSDGNLAECSVEKNTLSGEGTIAAELDVTDSSGYVKAMVMDAETLRPLATAKTYTPYAEDIIESAVPMYEGFTTKAATFGYDDGIVSDARLIEILDKYGAKATFNINSGFLYSRWKNTAAAAGFGTDEESVYAYIKSVYSGHEISTHGKYHYPACFDEGEIGYTSTGTQLVGKSTEEQVADLVDCATDLRQWLGLADDEVIGLSWPQGNGAQRSDYESDLLPAIKNAGIKYARHNPNGTFLLPENWYEWHSTCRHPDASDYIDGFVDMKNEGELKCFFVNGHTYEFDDAGDDESLNWTMIENIIKTLSEQGNIYFATMGDIYRYAEATKLVEITDTSVINNSDMTVYYNINGVNTELAPGEEYKQQ